MQPIDRPRPDYPLGKNMGSSPSASWRSHGKLGYTRLAKRSAENPPTRMLRIERSQWGRNPLPSKGHTLNPPHEPFPWTGCWP